MIKLGLDADALELLFRETLTNEACSEPRCKPSAIDADSPIVNSRQRW